MALDSVNRWIESK
jgi:hypothetical protein